ncbi:MAG: hypothetical protein WD278_02845 [Pirellulales bacterium]
MPKLFRSCRSIYLSYFSKPAQFRPLYRLIRKRRVRKILEIGVGTLERTVRMIELAGGRNGPASYTGIDLFELRSAAGRPGVPLKLAHRRLSRLAARARLIPGDPLTALARTANALGTFDLIVVSADQDPQSMSKAWFYLPRLIKDGTCVLVEQSDPTGALQLLTVPEIERRAADAVPRRRAA